MAQDIRELFKDDKIAHEKMPENHEQRFIEKLDAAFPESKKSSFGFMRIAASVVLLLGLGYASYKGFNAGSEIKGTESETPVATTKTDETMTLGDVSPGLKKVEDYYLASINLELSKIKYTPETKDLFDGYIEQLGELDKEYKRLSLELTESGPSELTVSALIDNLKLRLNLLYRLKSKLKELSTSEAGAQDTEQIS